MFDLSRHNQTGNLPGLKVFVYGTLKPERFYWQDYCEGKVDRWVEATAQGKLYQLDLGYPGLVEGSETVHGYVLWLKDEAALSGIDELEGYQPNRPTEANEYTRKAIDCYTPDGDPLTRAWTYFMTPEKVQSHKGQHIPGGVWERED